MLFCEIFVFVSTIKQTNINYSHIFQFDILNGIKIGLKATQAAKQVLLAVTSSTTTSSSKNSV